MTGNDMARAAGVRREPGAARRSWLERLRDGVNHRLAVAAERAVGRLRGTALLEWLHARHFESLEVREVGLPIIPPEAAPGLEGLRIALLSDLHAGTFVDAEDLLGVFGEVAAREPDLVCLGGDLVSVGCGQIGLLGPGLEVLRAPLGVYAVPGNHEYHEGGGFAGCARFLGRHGVEVLVNRGRRIPRGARGSLWLAGIDDLRRGAPDLDAALGGRRPGEPALLLSHNPDVFPRAAALGVDLVLAGHTHGGQIRIGGWAPVTHSRLGYRDGLYRRSPACLYVGRGVGTAVLPLRIGAPPEVPIVRLEREARLDGASGEVPAGQAALVGARR